MARRDASTGTDAIGEPAVEEGFLARAAFGERDVAFALQCLHRAEEDGFAALAARFQQAVERRQRARPDVAVDHHVGIVARGAVERLERALEEAARQRVVWGKSVSVRVDLGGRRLIKKKN